MATEICPCPFCGGEGAYGCFDGALFEHWIQCVKCSAIITSDDQKEDICSVWNRRASPWRPISEAPEGEVIDIWIASHGVRVANAKFNAQSQTWEVEGDLTLRAYAFEPTHFMPIPKGPEDS